MDQVREMSGVKTMEMQRVMLRTGSVTFKDLFDQNSNRLYSVDSDSIEFVNMMSPRYHRSDSHTYKLIEDSKVLEI